MKQKIGACLIIYYYFSKILITLNIYVNLEKNVAPIFLVALDPCLIGGTQLGLVRLRVKIAPNYV